MADSPYTPGMTPMSTPYVRATLDGRELVNPVSLELMECDTPVNDSFTENMTLGHSMCSPPVLPASPGVGNFNPGLVGLAPIRSMGEDASAPAPIIPAPVMNFPTAPQPPPLQQCSSNPFFSNQTV